MNLQGKLLEKISEADLQALIDNGVRESQTLEYKRGVYGRGDEEVREMLRDISSIANAFGGDLLIGVEEDGDGVPVALPGIENGEAEAARIVGSCLSNIAERIPGLRAWPVSLHNGRHVICLRIPRSLRAPHMVTLKGLNQFWARHDRQKAPMSIHEIRDVCLRVEGLMERLERFLEKRKREILEEIGSMPHYIIAVTPIFVGTEVVEIRDQELRELLYNPPGQRYGGWTVPTGVRPEPTLDGLQAEIHDWKTLELFRNGHTELRIKIDQDRFCLGQAELGGQQHWVLHPHALVEYPISLLRLSKAIYARLGLTDPVVVSLCLYNVIGFALYRYATNDPVASYYGPRPWHKQHLEIPAKQVPSWDEPDKVAKGFVDRIWQAFRYEQAPLFDDQGYFQP